MSPSTQTETDKHGLAPSATMSDNKTNTDDLSGDRQDEVFTSTDAIDTDSTPVQQLSVPLTSTASKTLEEVIQPSIKDLDNTDTAASEKQENESAIPGAEQGEQVLVHDS